jgi:hypothetical protein
MSQHRNFKLFLGQRKKLRARFIPQKVWKHTFNPKKRTTSNPRR